MNTSKIKLKTKPEVVYEGKYFEVIKKSNDKFEINYSIFENIVSPTRTEFEAINKVNAMDWAFDQGYIRGSADYEEFGDDYYDD
ncbi:hypothetical protein [Clostridium perfringens]|uniref:hypothetical protein n=1 Tax=Clostridium perfringens TaxID=1502 RepID=UPI002340536B|nr:hypothetical protein [Clostridium perfringens]MDC4245582.1 hypothetical protein [Clostridium perfringens]